MTAAAAALTSDLGRNLGLTACPGQPELSAMKTGRPGHRGLSIAAVVLAFAFSFANAAAADLCAFPTSPRIIASEGLSSAKGSRLIQAWEFPDAPIYWSTADPIDPGFQTFVAGVAQHVPVTDPVRLLRASPAWNNPRLQQNNALVADRADDWIRPADCLEKLLLTLQHGRVDLFERPTEFAALVLRSPEGDRLRVYYLTINEDGIGRMSPLTEPAIADVEAGWRLEIALHNHSFHPGQPSLDGVLAPSEADAQFAVNLAADAGLRAAWITNGLHTSRIPAQAFGLFVSPAAK